MKNFKFNTLLFTCNSYIYLKDVRMVKLPFLYENGSLLVFTFLGIY